jgi:hypothetical protein
VGPILYTRRVVANARTSVWFGLFLIIVGVCYAFGSLANIAGQTNNSKPVLILESTNNIYGIGGKDTQLLVRLKQNGTVEWEESVWQKPRGRTYQRKTSSISSEQVTSISNRLAVLSKDSFQAKMGPYNSYTDTSVELQIRMLTPTGSVAFSVLNPWLCTLPSCSIGKSKPIPEDVKAVICEAQKLRAQLAGEAVDPMCKPQ